MQLKAEGRGGGPPCSALEQIVGHEYESQQIENFDRTTLRNARTSTARLFVTETWAIFFFAPGARGNAFPTLPHAPQCIPDVRNHYLKITPNLPPASCWNPGSVPFLGAAAAAFTV